MRAPAKLVQAEPRAESCVAVSAPQLESEVDQAPASRSIASRAGASSTIACLLRLRKNTGTQGRAIVASFSSCRLARRRRSRVQSTARVSMRCDGAVPRACQRPDEDAPSGLLSPYESGRYRSLPVGRSRSIATALRFSLGDYCSMSERAPIAFSMRPPDFVALLVRLSPR